MNFRMLSLNKSLSQSNSCKEQKIIKEYRQLFETWRRFRLIAALSASTAILPAAYSYEFSYSASRTAAKCDVISENTTIPRIVCLVLSLIAIFFQFLYKINYYRWEKLYPQTFIELPPPFSPTFLELIEMLRQKSFYEFLFDDNTFYVILLFLILPYPGMHIEVYITQQYLYKPLVICYYLDEIFYFIMFLRLAYLGFTAFSFGKFSTAMSKWTADKERVKLSPILSIKCYAKLYPIRILAFVFLIPGIVVFGIGVRLFERPLRFQDFDSILNSMWCITVTMTTIGYGDTVPSSIFSRLVVCLSILWGGIILSLTFVTIGNFLKLNASEKLAFNNILASKESGEAIHEFCVKFLGRSKPNKFRAFVLKIMELMKIEVRYQVLLSNDTKRFREMDNVENRIEAVSKQAANIQKKLKRFLKELDNEKS